jgi:hypothetical protein
VPANDTALERFAWLWHKENSMTAHENFSVRDFVQPNQDVRQDLGFRAEDLDIVRNLNKIYSGDTQQSKQGGTSLKEDFNPIFNDVPKKPEDADAMARRNEKSRMTGKPTEKNHIVEKFPMPEIYVPIVKSFSPSPSPDRAAPIETAPPEKYDPTMNRIIK